MTMNPILIPAAELEFQAHQVFKTYRPIAPFIRREDGAYVAIRASDVEKLGTDPRTRQMETESVVARGATQGPLFDFFNHSMLLSNGPRHRQRRAPLSRAFAFKVVNDLRPHIRRIVSDLIDKHFESGSMHLRDELAALVPARVTADILGIAAADIPEFTQNVYQLARALGSSFGPEDIPGLDTAANNLTQYVERLFDERHREPRDDLLTSYLENVEEAQVLIPPRGPHSDRNGDIGGQRYFACRDDDTGLTVAPASGTVGRAVP
jgi:cytochrome P450